MMWRRWAVVARALWRVVKVRAEWIAVVGRLWRLRLSELLMGGWP